jgi:signal transduction histidine kinase
MGLFGKRHRAPSATGRRTRLAAIALGVGVGLILIFALVFSIAFGTRRVAQHADALHNADEALRAATVARAQAGLATHFVLLESEFNFDASDAITLAVDDVTLAVTDLEEGIATLGELTGGLADEIETTSEAFLGTVIGILGHLNAGEPDLAREAAQTLDPEFRAFIAAVVVERDFQASQVAAANNLMGRVGDIVRFLVAFLVPTAVIVVYRELSKRQQRQSELEVRLEAEQDLGQARDEFVANASHELRTPLTSIFGLAHLLEEDPVVTGSDSSREMVDMIISETHDLSRMVDDLLTTARLDAGALHYQFETLPILEEVNEVVEPMTKAGGQIRVDIHPSMVRSDRLRIRQVLRNLLSNARKYGGEDIRVIGRVVSGWYEVIVADNGEGIPDELRNRLFDRFLHQGDMPLVLGSVGLGLSIVRALAEGMGGAVWYERRKGWTKFVVRVPLAADQGEGSRFKEPELYRKRRSLESAGGMPELAPVDGSVSKPAQVPLPRSATTR